MQIFNKKSIIIKVFFSFFFNSIVSKTTGSTTYDTLCIIHHTQEHLPNIIYLYIQSVSLVVNQATSWGNRVIFKCVYLFLFFVLNVSKGVLYKSCSTMVFLKPCVSNIRIYDGHFIIVLKR